MTVHERCKRLIETHKERAYRAAYRISGNAEDALDALQDACCKLFERADVVGDEFAGPWLARVAVNRALDIVRRRDPLRGARQLDDELHGDGAGEDEPTDVRERLAAALVGLSARQSEVIVLRVLEGHSFASIARTLRITEGATKTHFKRGMAALRRQLGSLRRFGDEEGIAKGRSDGIA